METQPDAIDHFSSIKPAKTGWAEEGHLQRYFGFQKNVKISHESFICLLVNEMWVNWEKKEVWSGLDYNAFKCLNDGSLRVFTQDSVLSLGIKILLVTWIETKMCIYNIFKWQNLREIANMLPNN